MGVNNHAHRSLLLAIRGRHVREWNCPALEFLAFGPPGSHCLADLGLVAIPALVNVSLEYAFEAAVCLAIEVVCVQGLGLPTRFADPLISIHRYVPRGGGSARSAGLAELGALFGDGLEEGVEGADEVGADGVAVRLDLVGTDFGEHGGRDDGSDHCTLAFRAVALDEFVGEAREYVDGDGLGRHDLRVEAPLLGCMVERGVRVRDDVHLVLGRQQALARSPN